MSGVQETGREPHAARGRWVRRLSVAAGLVGATVLGVGLLHTSVGRPLLMKLGGCPVGQVDPHEAQAQAQLAVAAGRGTEPARSRPALGFRLDQTTLADVQAWAEQHDLACERGRDDTLFQCKLVPATALPAPLAMAGSIDDLTFAFREDRTLWTVSAWSFHMPAAAALVRVKDVGAEVERHTGTQATRFGSVDAIGREAGQGAGLKFAMADYVAKIVATTGTDGVDVRQQYSSVRSPTVPD